MFRIKALLFGINYLDSQYKLKGCINDVMMIKNYLIKYLYVDPDNITVCTDLTKTKPTKKNIINLINENINLVNQNYDILWIHYSGHGDYILDKNDDENKKNDIIEGNGKFGYDEVLCTIDNKFITDDEFNNLFSKLNKNKKLICIFDCCHSGTILDLKYKYNYKKNVCYIDNNKNNINCDAILFSGCKDIQKSKDVCGWSKKYKYSGAFTTSILNILRYNNNLSIDNIIEYAKKILEKRNLVQEPQITSSILINKYTKLLDINLINLIQKRKIIYIKKINLCKKLLKIHNNEIYLNYLNYYTKLLKNIS